MIYSQKKNPSSLIMNGEIFLHIKFIGLRVILAQ